MVLPILSALANFVSRARKLGDDVYNARRRFTRRAERLMKEAQKTTGAAAQRKREQAIRNLQDASKLYEKERDRVKFDKKMKDKYGVDLSDVEMITNPKKRGQLVNESFDVTGKASRERAAREIMSSAGGKRIMASTSDIWSKAVKVNAEGETVIDTSLAYALIKQHFGANDMMDVIEIYERRFGPTLYENPDDEERYKEIVRAATEYIRDLARAS